MFLNTIIACLAFAPLLIQAAPWNQDHHHKKPTPKPWKPHRKPHPRGRTVTEIVYYVPTVIKVTETKTRVKTVHGTPSTVTDFVTSTLTSSVPTTTTQTIYATATSVSVTVAVVTVNATQTVTVPTTVPYTVYSTTTAPTTITASTYPQPTGRALYANVNGMTDQAVSPGATTPGNSGPPYGYSIRSTNGTTGLYLFDTVADSAYVGQSGPTDFFIFDPATAAATGADSCVIGYSQSAQITGNGFTGLAYASAPQCTRDGFLLTSDVNPFYFAASLANGAKANQYNSVSLVYTDVGTGPGQLAAPSDGNGPLIVVFPPSQGAALVLPANYANVTLSI